MTDISDVRKSIIEKILKQREYRFNLPGSEWDINNDPNDWISIIISYVSKETKQGNIKINKENFEESLIEAAAIIVAALEYSDNMKNNGSLK